MVSPSGRPRPPPSGAEEGSPGPLADTEAHMVSVSRFLKERANVYPVETGARSSTTCPLDVLAQAK